MSHSTLLQAHDAALDRFQRSIIDAYKLEFRDDPAYPIARNLAEKWGGLPADTLVMGNLGGPLPISGHGPVPRFQAIYIPFAPLWSHFMGLARSALTTARAS